MLQGVFSLGFGLLAGFVSGLLGLGGGLILTPLLTLLFQSETSDPNMAAVAAAATAQVAGAASLSINLLFQSRVFDPISRPLAAGLLMTARDSQQHSRTAQPRARPDGLARNP